MMFVLLVIKHYPTPAIRSGYYNPPTKMYPERVFLFANKNKPIIV